MTEGYQALRERAARLDLSRRAKIVLTGEDRVRLLHALTTNHIEQLAPGSGCYTFFLNAQGRIQADANVFVFDDRILLDMEPETRERMVRHIDHYIIADDFIIPPELEHFCSEKVLRLPCYQPNDRRRAVAERPPSRAEAGLPEDAFVYCCFNGTQKITPRVFGAWMQVLAAAEGSVLWLLDSAPDTNARLRNMAGAAGIAPERLCFAPKRPNPQHLARYVLADLFLDTCPYGAHTTASDAMWMGTPVLTLEGRGFAAFSASGWPFVASGGGNGVLDPPLTHCVGSAVVGVPLESARFSVNAERDGGGAATTLTELL